MNDINKEAAKFFKENKKYHRILKGMAEKYKSLESLGGSIELKNLTAEEQLILSKINSKFISSRDAKFSVQKFIKTFDGTKLEGIDFVGVLKEYFNDEIKTNKEVKNDKEKIKQDFFNEILVAFENTEAAKWLLSALESKSFGYMLIIKEYESNNKILRETLFNVVDGINKLINNKQLTRLAIFASEVTRNPHYFDSNQIGGKLLISALSYISKVQTPENSEEENELLYNFGILRDEISNHTTFSNVLIYSNNEEHPGVRGFYDNNEPLQLNLWNLSRIDYSKCTKNTLFVFENPSVFSEVLLRTSDLKPSLLCTSGQLKLASLVLLDKTINNVDRIYYSGDFDPEGINIAFKLKQRYGDKLCYWRYDVESYKKVKSNINLDDRRIKQIEKIEDEMLSELIDEIKVNKYCGYQELLVDVYVEEIRGILDI